MQLTSPSFQIGQRETEEMNYQILVKHSSIRNMGIGWDVFREPCKCPIICSPLSTLLYNQQTSSSICTHLLILNKGAIIIASRKVSNERALTRPVIAYLHWMMPMPALPHMHINSVSFSPTRMISANLREYAAMSNASLSPSAFLIAWMPLQCASSGKTSSTLYPTGSQR